MEKIDRLWPDGFQFYFDDQLFQPGTDSFLLGAFPALRRGEQVCDLGGGTGLLGLLLLAREPDLHLTEVELQAAACALCRKNIALNHLDRQMDCLEADLRCLSQLRAGSFDLVVANPPYFASGSGYHAENDARKNARTELTCTLDDVLAAAARLLRWGGRLALVFRTERLAELLAGCREKKMEPKRLRFIQKNARSAPSLFLLECRRGGKTGLRVEAPLLLQEADGSPTAELNTIYFRDQR